MLIINVFSCGLLLGFQSTPGFSVLYLCLCGNPCQRTTCICRCYWKKATPKHIQYLQYVIYIYILYTRTCLFIYCWAEQPYNPPKKQGPNSKKNNRHLRNLCIFIPQYYDHLSDDFYVALPCPPLKVGEIDASYPRYIPLIPQRITSHFWMPAMSVVPLSRLVAS